MSNNGGTLGFLLAPTFSTPSTSPHALGEVLRKLVSKVVFKQRGPAFSAQYAHFCPDTLREGETTALQHVGVAVPGGADRMIHSTGAYISRGPPGLGVRVR